MSELADRCPECMAETPALPLRVRAAPGESVRADYHCLECCHEWFTCWETGRVA